MTAPKEQPKAFVTREDIERVKFEDWLGAAQMLDNLFAEREAETERADLLDDMQSFYKSEFEHRKELCLEAEAKVKALEAERDALTSILQRLIVQHQNGCENANHLSVGEDIDEARRIMEERAKKEEQG